VLEETLVGASHGEFGEVALIRNVLRLFDLEVCKARQQAHAAVRQAEAGRCGLPRSPQKGSGAMRTAACARDGTCGLRGRGAGSRKLPRLQA